MRERTSLQPTSVRVRLLTGSEYTVEHRNFENWSSACVEDLKEEVCWIRDPSFQRDTSEQGYSPDPSSRVGSGVQTMQNQPVCNMLYVL